MTAHLAGFGVFGWVAILVGAWTITAVLVAPWIGRAMRDEDIRQRAQYPPPVPAPVTPPSQTVPSADWFAGLPVEILSDDAVHSLFDSIVDGEFA